MKKILFILAAALGSLLAPQLTHASNDTVMQTSISSYTTVGVSISTGVAYSSFTAPTDVTGGTDWRQVCVQNLDTSKYLACSESVNVTTQTASANVGNLISPAASATQPAQPTCFFIVMGQRFYCETSSTSATTRAVITKAR